MKKIIGAIVLNHEYEECYQNIYWQIMLKMKK